MKYAVLPVLLATGLFSQSVAAQNVPSFTFAEAFYTQSDFDSDFDTTGFGIKGSYEFGEYFFVEANYTQSSGDLNNFDIDYDTFQYGLGAKYALENGITIFASYNLGDWKLEEESAGNESFDVDTFKLGFRSNITDAIELNAAYTNTDPEEGDRESGFALGANYKVADTWFITAEFSRIAGDGDVDTVNFGLRKTF